MRHLVVLCRHGNTFNPGEKVVMVGAREDLPLTSYGREQAHGVAAALKESQVPVQSIYAGPLKRTAEFAAIVAHDMGARAPIHVDDRLRELDYGAWGGLSNEEIVKLSGEDSVRQWREQGVRPEGVLFTPSTEVLEAEAQSFLSDLTKGPSVAVVVTSNGRMREFGRIISGGREKAAQVKTGHSCVLVWEHELWSVIGWDLEPHEMAGVLRAEATRDSSGDLR